MKNIKLKQSELYPTLELNTKTCLLEKYQFLINNKFDYLLEQAPNLFFQIFDLPPNNKAYNFWEPLVEVERNHISNFLKMVNPLLHTTLSCSDIQFNPLININSKLTTYKDIHNFRFSYLQSVVSTCFRGQLAHNGLFFWSAGKGEQEKIISITQSLTCEFCKLDPVFTVTGLIEEARLIAMVLSFIHYCATSKIILKIR